MVLWAPPFTCLLPSIFCIRCVRPLLSPCLIDTHMTQIIKKVTRCNQRRWFGQAKVTVTFEGSASVVLEFVRAGEMMVGESRNCRKASFQRLKEERAIIWYHKTVDGSGGLENAQKCTSGLYIQKYFQDRKEAFWWTQFLKGCTQKMKRKSFCKKEPREQCVLLRIASKKLKIPPHQLRLAKCLGRPRRLFKLDARVQDLYQSIHIICLCVWSSLIYNYYRCV